MGGRDICIQKSMHMERGKRGWRKGERAEGTSEGILPQQQQQQQQQQRKEELEQGQKQGQRQEEEQQQLRVRAAIPTVRELYSVKSPVSRAVRYPW